MEQKAKENKKKGYPKVENLSHSNLLRSVHFSLENKHAWLLQGW